jgi:hypothetical protein
MHQYEHTHHPLFRKLADFTLLSTDNLSFTCVLGLINFQNHAVLNDFDDGFYSSHRSLLGKLADFTLLSTDNLSFTRVLGLINCQNQAALNDFDVLLCIKLVPVKLGTYAQLIGHSPHSHLSAFSDLREAGYSSLTLQLL